MSPPPSLEAEASGQRWLIDGFNVLHVALLHGRERGRWWEEGARERLMARLARFDEPGIVALQCDVVRKPGKLSTKARISSRTFR